ncbi:branched-chain amino acid ABC transporter permease [Aromatoleum aromaticum]|uniref:Predicted branched-chain amino acid ABC-type transport system, permease components n=1 Tax=Aromatoleum aromaticum (strain DSM 19018 / LMG 30748 / EbN1) TaxID=76114 RepID=Q5P4W6_AROAE|nr:branched-chain amino acid ABC transporter permease [Aromatoleum aromaticum]NMG55291.1 branched-chain amino acid ABC transporter permease [Aromatoleum aromaticum]CAI07646.1 predicted branched-chain amino acid ABC-type transport system, permease components [Aromatoleum aromaticum EbN1]
MSGLALVQVLSSGIATGCIYGLVALSFVLIYKATGTVSFMQGELLMAGAFAVLALHLAAGWPLAWAAAGGIAGMAAFGAVLERTLLRRALGQAHLTALLLTFGLGMMLRGAIGSVPAATHSMHRLALPFAGESWRFGGLAIAAEHIVVIGATAVLALALTLFFRRTRAGIALRACSENPGAAALMGVSVAGMHTLAWALGAGLAAAAGLLLAPVTFVHPNMGLVALKAFPAAVLGGMTSLPGALAGGVFIGVVEALAGFALPEGVKDVVPYVLLMLALLLFPHGLAGGLRRR